jgi:hypothetical protein
MMETAGAFAAFHDYEDENGDEQIKFIGSSPPTKRGQRRQ